MTDSFQIQIIQEEYSIDNLFETSIVVNVLLIKVITKKIVNTEKKVKLEAV